MTVEPARIKAAIQDQLVRFDITSKKIELIKQAANMSSKDNGRLSEKLQSRQDQITSLQKELNAEEFNTQNLQNENPPNMKKLEKQYAKIEKLRAVIDEATRAIETITQKFADLDKAKQMESKLDEFQANYKQLLANLMNLHGRYPDVYKEAEQECGIFFLTSPQSNESP